MLWQVVELLCAQQQVPMPGDAARSETLEADKFNQLLGKEP